ncbi:MAG: metalloregulator ArsR/SmtB family transcription factor [Hydrogenovibrio sp.]|nr:metalloregulator ArsR/SmtB family transcription factor [Hydrogenovibrio sp.]
MSTLKKQLFEQLAKISQCLASPQRIELLDYLAQAERTVEELSRLSGLTFANASRHLQVLKQDGLVLVKKQGKQRIYQIAGPDVVLLVQALRRTAETHLAEMDRLKAGFDSVESPSEEISRQRLLSHLEDEAFMLVDVRPEKEFSEGHIQGAINIPPERIEQAVADLPDGKTLVAYCRGPYCVYSYQLLEALRKKGRTAYRLEEGFPEWKAEGLPWSS